MAVTLYSLGGHLLHRGENGAARVAFERALALDRELGDRHHAALVLSYASLAALRQGDRITARAFQEESLAIKRAMGDSRGVGSSLMYLADIAGDEGDYREARTHLQESLDILLRMGDSWNLVEALGRCARVEAEAGRADRAARLFAAAQRLRDGMGGAVRSAERAGHEWAEAAVRASLGPKRFAAAWAEGWSMTVEQAVEYARSPGSPEDLDAEQADRGLSGRQPIGRGSGLELTPREREVAALVARGLTDPQIAATLAIGTRTVETHVANCRGKLALATRAQLAVWAVQHGVGASD